MTKFKIHTLDWPSFNDACLQLRTMVDASGFYPDAVIAIPRGGEYLRQSAWSDIPTLQISINRPSKFSLKKLVSKFLPLLPAILRDRLRIWDAKRLIRRSEHMNNSKIIVPAIPLSVKRILIIDDAVDSGATLRMIMSVLMSMRNDIEFKSAVITVTSDKPLCIPDYYLYHNSTLVRMPWSIDAK